MFPSFHHHLAVVLIETLSQSLHHRDGRIISPSMHLWVPATICMSICLYVSMLSVSIFVYTYVCLFLCVSVCSSNICSRTGDATLRSILFATLVRLVRVYMEPRFLSLLQLHFSRFSVLCFLPFFPFLSFFLPFVAER